MIRYSLKKFWMMTEADDGVWITHADHQKELGYAEERISSAKKDCALLWDHTARQYKKIQQLDTLYRTTDRYVAAQRRVIKHLEDRLVVSIYLTALGWGVILILLILFSLGAL